MAQRPCKRNENTPSISVNSIAVSCNERIIVIDDDAFEARVLKRAWSDLVDIRTNPKLFQARIVEYGKVDLVQPPWQYNALDTRAM